MPGGDRTGPVGMEPLTGRAAGFCAGYSMPGHTNPVGGRGFLGRGRGFGNQGGGRGRRNWFHATGLPGWARTGYGPPFAAPLTVEKELDSLKGQAEYFSDALEDIRRRIEDIESRSAKNAE